MTAEVLAQLYPLGLLALTIGRVLLKGTRWILALIVKRLDE